MRHEAEYFIPTEYHNPMELFASTAIWDGGKLVVYDKTQGVQNVQRYLCGVFEMQPDEVSVMSPYMGGGFGAGLRPQYQVVLAVLGARALKRPVRVVLTRAQMYGLGYRPATIERLALGANAGGTLDAIMHEAIAVTSQFEEFSRNDTGWADLLYKSPNTKFVHRLARLDVPTSSDMRAPGAATGVYALECAMDELAIALKIDPVQLRLQCYSDRDQNSGLPYSSKQLRECYRQGAAAFGWDKRNPEPRSMRDGSELVGWGMATGVWEALQMPAAVRIVLTANGHAEVATAASDIGTGTYTIMAQVAADMLGLPIDNISVKLGDSTLPRLSGRGRVVDRSLGLQCHREYGPRGSRRPAEACQPDEGFAAGGRRRGRSRTDGRQDRQQAGCEPRDLDRERDAVRQCGAHHPRGDQQFRGRQGARAQRALRRLCRGQGGRRARCHPRHPRRQRGRGRTHPQPQRPRIAR